MTLELRLADTLMPRPREDGPYDSEYLGFGTQFRTLNATLRTQLVAQKWRVRIYWVGLSRAERSSVMSAFGDTLTAARTLILPDNFTCSVQGVLGSWTERVWYSPWTSEPYYDISFQIEQV